MSAAPWTAATKARHAGQPRSTLQHTEFGMIPRCWSLAAYRAAYAVRTDYIGSAGMWPERAAKHPESLERSLERVK
jgi:hypothetical protein